MANDNFGSNDDSFQGIDVGAIEKKLAGMWRDSEPPREPRDKQAPAITRACVLNLIIIASASEDCDAVSSLLDKVSTEHPGRAFLVLTDRKSDVARLESKASIRCRQVSSTRREICGEQITLVAEGLAVETSPSAIAPLLVPDVPVFLWWKEAPDFDDHLWNNLIPLCDRVIVDSASFARPLDDLRAMTSYLALAESQIKLTDLNWSRLSSWRTLIASFWDNPVYLDHLQHLKQVSIGFCPANGDTGRYAVKPLLLTGWLASRLGWKCNSSSVSNDLTIFEMQADGREITVNIRPTEYEPHCSGLVTSIAFSTEGELAGFDVFLSREGNRLSTEVRIGGVVTAGRTLTYEPKDLSRRLSSELSFFTRDAVFEESLAVTAEILKSA